MNTFTYTRACTYSYMPQTLQTQGLFSGYDETSQTRGPSSSLDVESAGTDVLRERQRVAKEREGVNFSDSEHRIPLVSGRCMS